MQLDNAKALGEKLSGNGTRECLTVHDDQLLHLLQTLLSHHLQQLAETTAQNEGRKRGGGRRATAGERSLTDSVPNVKISLRADTLSDDVAVDEACDN